MDKQQLIYKVLKLVNENKEDGNISKNEMINALKYLNSEKFIRLKSTKRYINQDKDDIYSIENSEITIEGFKYLQDNSKLNKAYNAIKKVVDLKP